MGTPVRAPWPLREVSADGQGTSRRIVEEGLGMTAELDARLAGVTVDGLKDVLDAVNAASSKPAIAGADRAGLVEKLRLILASVTGPNLLALLTERLGAITEES